MVNFRLETLSEVGDALGARYVVEGRQRDAIADFDVAERLSPADPLLWAFYSLRAWAYLNLGEFDDAIHWATKCAALPDSTFWPYWTLTVAHFMKGDLKSAQQAKDSLCDATRFLNCVR